MSKRKRRPRKYIYAVGHFSTACATSFLNIFGDTRRRDESAIDFSSANAGSCEKACVRIASFCRLWKSCVCCVNVGTCPAILFTCPLRVNRRESRADTPRRFGGRKIERDARGNQGHADIRARTAFPQQKVITRALLQDNQSLSTGYAHLWK